MTEVWVLTFDATGPEPGDYWGQHSVHATKHSAMLRVFDCIWKLGIDPRAPEVQVVEGGHDDDTQVCNDLEAYGWQISFGAHLMPVES